MAGKAVTRADLTEAVLPEGRTHVERSANLVEQVLGEICDTLVRGENVELSGFGNFNVRNKGERVGRNPKTGVEVPIEKHWVLTFKPSSNLKAYVNGEGTEREY